MTARAADAHSDRAGAREGPGATARAEARVGLYVHVPFCAVRCSYCDFSSGSLSAKALERYLVGMEREAVRRAPHAAGVTFTSVFFGGGTPSALAARPFARLWSALRSHFTIAPDAEITLESNPESVRPALLEAWASAGVNRLSMGAQSFHADELVLLGRIHDADRPGAAFALARAYGFKRLSLDLMYAFPGNTSDRFAATVERALALEPEHLSAYCFIPEAGTPLGDEVLRGTTELPETGEQAELFARLCGRLADEGFGIYETSNFCRPGGEARHNLVYWLRRDYLGLGPSAHGLWRGERYGNHYAPERWAAALEADVACDTIEAESDRSRADEIVMLGLRLATGLSAADHAPARWSEVTRHYGRAFRDALATGRLERTVNGVRIAPEHRFLADDVIAWLMAAADREPAVRLGRATMPQLTLAAVDRAATLSVT